MRLDTGWLLTIYKSMLFNKFKYVFKAYVLEIVNGYTMLYTETVFYYSLSVVQVRPSNSWEHYLHWVNYKKIIYNFNKKLLKNRIATVLS